MEHKFCSELKQTHICPHTHFKKQLSVSVVRICIGNGRCGSVFVSPKFMPDVLIWCCAIIWHMERKHITKIMAAPIFIWTHIVVSLVICRCYLEDGASKGAWLNRSSIIFAGGDKWSVDPRVSISTLNKRDYSLQIQNVDVTDDGPYTCSVQTQHTPRTMQVHLTVQGMFFQMCSTMQGLLTMFNI